MDDREQVANYLLFKKALIDWARERCAGHVLNQLAPNYRYEMAMFELQLGEFIHETESGLEIGDCEYTLEV